jgi:uncharacterized protein (TIGR02145 family)
MKNISLLLLCISITLTAFTQEKNMRKNNTETYTDQRDGTKYKLIKIGKQIWMAENLAYKVETACWAYDDDNSNVSKYGYLYNYETAKNVCPTTDGWRLPTKSDFDELLQNTGNNHGERYTTLMKNGKSGFATLNSGWRNLNDTYSHLGKYAAFVSATETDEKNAWVLYFDGMNAYPFGLTKGMGYSVRCIKDI